MSNSTIGKVSISGSGEVDGWGIARVTYDRIRILAERHGARFDTPEARVELATVANSLAGSTHTPIEMAKGGQRS